MRAWGSFMPCDLNSEFPSLAWHRFYSHRTAKQTSKSGCDLIRGDTMRPFQLDHPLAIPLGLDYFGRHAPDVGCGNHRYGLVEWLQEARDCAVPGRRSDVPTRILHEPSWP